MTRRSFLKYSGTGIFSLSMGLSRATGQEKRIPNILIIVADDLGWNAVGYHNEAVKTPNIDERICRQGIELDQFYVSPMCSPTRCGLMTGRYPIRYGCARAVMPPWRDHGLPTDELMMSELLAQAGYEHRGVFGKWHMGHSRKRYLPLRRGFTRFYGHYNGALDYYTHEREGELDWHDDWDACRDEGYGTELIATKAADFVREHADEPFFCYVPFSAPHSPFQAPKKYLDMYADIEDEKKRTYYAMITCMDDGIGKILDVLDSAGIADHTLVWFFSDNGGVGSIHGNNDPLHGSKLTSFEGGVRVVSCARYSDWMTGVKVSVSTAFVDLLPTVAALVGLDPEKAGAKPLDGMDLNPILKGQPAQMDRTLFFYHGQSGPENEQCSIIKYPWKLVANGPDLRKGVGDRDLLLYDLSNDPNETENVAAAHPKEVKSLLEECISFRTLQPDHAIPPFHVGREGFEAPKDWVIEDE